MIKTNTLFAKLLFTTIRIEAHLANGRSSVGTGFFFLFDQDKESSVLVLVTNKHVIQSADEVTFWLHESNNQNEPIDSSVGISLRGSGKTRVSDWWIYHPADDVDLCAVPCAYLFSKAEEMNKTIYLQALDEEQIPTEDVLNNLMPFEDILMIGSPIGLWDEFNNLPLVRRGITASHPAIDFKGNPTGVVDIAAFPGSSGSPILIADSLNKVVSDESNSSERVILLGVLFAGPQFSANGDIEIVNVPTMTVSAVNMMIPAHLGFYVKARELLILKEAVIETFNKYRAAFLTDAKG